MSSIDIFNQFYKKSSEGGYSKSLYFFFEQIVRPKLLGENLVICEMGSGNYSLFEDVTDFNAEVIALDFSKSAIASSPKSKIIYKELNVVNSLDVPDLTYDLVFDSHCLNCITNDEERASAFKNIYSSLKSGGIFASELMIQPASEHVSIPFKMIKTAMELEQEIISHGFTILYFTISNDSAFYSVVDGKEIKCDVLKIIAKK